MKTVTLNFSGQRTTAYINEDVSTSISLNGKKKTKISVKDANVLIKNLSIYHEGALYKTYKIED